MKTSPKTSLPGLVQWFGGKGLMKNKITSVLPSTRVYCEPYGGAASILFWKRPSLVEVYNDLDDRLVNLMRVLQSPKQSRSLIRRLKRTPYSRAEFVEALRVMNDEPSDDPVENAWAFFVCQNQGVSMDRCKSAGNWSRVFVTSRGQALNVSRYNRRIRMLGHMARRASQVQVDNRCALEVIRYWDSPETTFYIDPPYVTSTRKSGVYAHECGDDHHKQLVDILCDIQGNAVVSGYDHTIYDKLSGSGYRYVSFETSCHASVRGRNSGLQGQGAAMDKVPRAETLWILDRTDTQLWNQLKQH